MTIMDEVSNVTPQQLAALSAKVQDTEEPSMEETTMEATQQETESQRIQQEPGTYRDYDFHGRTIRTVIIDGALWFVARDVAICLGYAIPQKAVITHCKGVLKRNIPTAGGVQEMLIIQKHDVFRLVMHSTLPEAEQFQDWVYMEVLPSIDEKGGYVQDGREQEFLEKTGVSDAIKTLIDNPSQSLLVLSEMTRALVDARKETEAERQARLQAEKEKWQAQREAAENRLALTHVELQVEEMKPDAEFGRSLCADDSQR